MKSLYKSKQKHLGEYWRWFEERTQLSKAIGNNYSEGIGLIPIHYEKSAKRFLGGNLILLDRRRTKVRIGFIP